MFKKTFSSHLAIAATGILLTAATAMPALAQYRYRSPFTNPSSTPLAAPQKSANKDATSSAARTADQMTRMRERANREIAQRVTRLTALSARIQGMKKISDANKTNLAATIQGEITLLTNLKAKIAADTDLETMRTDFQSITKAYRIYALIMPQIAILGAADRVAVIGDALITVSQKLQTRVTAAGTAGNNVTALQASLSDMTAKIADARTQAQDAQKEVAALVPDNGDQAKFDANKQALKDAHEKIKTAMEDLRAARKDADMIARTLRTFTRPSPSATPSASATPTPSQS